MTEREEIREGLFVYHVLSLLDPQFAKVSDIWIPTAEDAEEGHFSVEFKNRSEIVVDCTLYDQNFKKRIQAVFFKPNRDIIWDKQIEDVDSWLMLTKSNLPAFLAKRVLELKEKTKDSRSASEEIKKSSEYIEWLHSVRGDTLGKSLGITERVHTKFETWKNETRNDKV